MTRLIAAALVPLMHHGRVLPVAAAGGSTKPGGSHTGEIVGSVAVLLGALLIAAVVSWLAKRRSPDSAADKRNRS